MFRRPLHVIIVGSIRGKGCEAVAGASGLVISKDFIPYRYKNTDPPYSLPSPSTDF